MFWCSLVGADRSPKEAMTVARQEDLGLCVFWSLSLSLQSVPRCKKVALYVFRKGRVDVLVLFGRSGLPAQRNNAGFACLKQEYLDFGVFC